MTFDSKDQDNDRYQEQTPFGVEDTGADETLRQVSDTVWEMLLDQFVAIPELATLTLTHIRLLYWIRERTPVTRSQVCNEFGASAITTARLIGKLNRQGLIDRCGDLFDPNVTYFHLSDAGSTLIARIEACQRRSYHRSLNRLTAAEFQCFSSGLDLLLRIEHPGDEHDNENAQNRVKP